MKLINTKRFSINAWITLHKGVGGFAFPLDIDWIRNRYCDTSFVLNIYILCFQINIYYEGNK